MERQKTCNYCSETKAATCFGVSNITADGLDNWCNDCLDLVRAANSVSVFQIEDGTFEGGAGGYIYLIRCETGHYKIGASKRPIERCGQIENTLRPFSAEIVLLIQTNNMFGDETKLHQKYEEYRVRGEWFMFDGADTVNRVMGDYERIELGLDI